MDWTVGTYLATRLEQIGLKHHFAVAGDYNLVLLDELLRNKNMQQVYCSNELNCGYSAEGYARANGAGAAVVTFSVGGLCALGPLGSAYAEDLPVILISGAPNSNDYGSDRILHHTLANYDLDYMREMARHVTCEAVTITHASQAPQQIDAAIQAALRNRKPAYIEIACNLPKAPCGAPGPVEALLGGKGTEPSYLAAATDAVAAFLNTKKKPLLLIGSRVRAGRAEAAVLQLAEALGCAVAVLPAAKSFFPEDHPQFIGHFWGEISSLGTQSLLNWADTLICVGTIFNDYSTVGWKARPEADRMVTVGLDRVSFQGHSFGQIEMAEFLEALAGIVQRQDATMLEYRKLNPQQPLTAVADATAKLTRAEVVRQVQASLTPETTVMVETGDSWFNGMQLHLPHGARFEVEMQWGAIGWSVPAAFGYALGAPGRRVVLMVGDGSFQLTAQEVAQMIRENLPILILLMNNRGYTIEAEIHDGPYNRVKNWDYAGLMTAFNADDGKGVGRKANTADELAEALKFAAGYRGAPVLIECAIDPDDCTAELITWGWAVAEANARPPVPTL